MVIDHDVDDDNGITGSEEVLTGWKLKITLIKGKNHVHKVNCPTELFHGQI